MFLFCGIVYLGLIVWLFRTYSLFGIVMSIFAILLNTILLGGVYSWKHNSYKDRPKFTFRKFLEMYNTAPNMFMLRKNHPIYMGEASRTIDFKTFFDHCRYRLFFEKNEKQKLLEVRERFEKEITEDLQKYIDKQEVADV